MKLSDHLNADAKRTKRPIGKQWVYLERRSEAMRVRKFAMFHDKRS